MKLSKIFLVLALFGAPLRAAAEVIELPEEELAKESVLPVFEKPVSVRNRNVMTAGRVDANLSYGLALSEPIANVSRFGVSLYYHTSENNAFGLLYAKNGGGLSMYANQLNDKYNLDFNRVPLPKQTIMGDWNWKMYYGKMSITKATTFNFSLYSTLAAGVVQYPHKSFPAIAPGLGQKFYFGKNFALRFDLRLQMNNAPIPFLAGRLRTVPNDPTPDYSEFQERLTYTTLLDAGLSWLF